MVHDSRHIELDVANNVSTSHVTIEYRCDDDIAAMSLAIRKTCKFVKPVNVRREANKIANLYASKVIDVYHS